MGLTYRVVSIGALSRNRLWNENEPKRLSHATTTLIQDGTTTILVDPSLPAEMLTQRLEERSGLAPGQIEVVFLTTFRPVHRRSLALFSQARWLMHGPEIDAIRDHLEGMADRARQDDDQEVKRLVRQELTLLERIRPAEDKPTQSVHLFPTPGLTPGSAGLLLATPTRTVVVAGDAILTQDYYEVGRVFEQAAAVAEARASFAEIVEIADEIIPGHDNLFAVAGR